MGPQVGSEREMESSSPRSRRRKASMRGAGQEEMLAMVILDFTVLAEGFADEDGGGRIAIGDLRHVHNCIVAVSANNSNSSDALT